MNKKEKKQNIKDLETLAEEIKILKDTHRQKHPIVIEFSGSPKSGKTSCINSLYIFLKRNGFNVDVVQERASVCPVSDKQSPMFNIWTSCMSLANMIGTYENKKNSVDVLILDRGIFDALCWFEWLSRNRKMERELKQRAENFLLHKDFVQKIDIVFVFKASPEVSIHREYANLLTSKMGTIMNPTVLEDYLASIAITKKNHGNAFHDVIEIDTSIKDQDCVGKEVTEKTLRSLREQLMEKIGYFVKTEKIKEVLATNDNFDYDNVKTLFPSDKIEFGLRNDVEKNDEFLQIVPIAVITNENGEVLVAKKKNTSRSEDSPEKDKPLLYFGGHTRSSDVTGITEKTGNDSFLEICKSTLKREIKEELGSEFAMDDIVPTIIYTRNHPKSSRHLAICFTVKIKKTDKLAMDPNELVQHKGTSKSGGFFQAKDLINEDMEAWSILILKKFFNITKEIPNPELTLPF